MKYAKTLALSLLLQIITFSLSAQVPNCKSVQTGSFKVSSPESGTTYIKRTKTQQIEKNDDLGYEVLFEVTWIDECTYELRPKKLIKGDPSIMGDGSSYVRTKMKNITAKGYTAEITSSFSEEVMEFVVEIVREKEKQ